MLAGGAAMVWVEEAVRQSRLGGDGVQAQLSRFFELCSRAGSCKGLGHIVLPKHGRLGAENTASAHGEQGKSAGAESFSTASKMTVAAEHWLAVQGVRLQGRQWATVFASPCRWQSSAASSWVPCTSASCVAVSQLRTCSVYSCSA